MRARIEARLAALLAEREQFVTAANARVTNYDVAIGELQTLLAAPVPPQEGTKERETRSDTGSASPDNAESEERDDDGRPTLEIVGAAGRGQAKGTGSAGPVAARENLNLT